MPPHSVIVLQSARRRTLGRVRISELSYETSNIRVILSVYLSPVRQWGGCGVQGPKLRPVDLRSCIHTYEDRGPAGDVKALRTLIK